MTTTPRSDTQAPLTRLGAYQVLRPLGRGGMAEVYLARIAATDPTRAPGHVALKVLDPSAADDADACALFFDEARIASVLRHPHIAGVIEADLADGRPYIAMELVHGADLRELLARAGRRGALPSYDVALAIVARAAAGLDHAHRQCGADGQPLGLVHRDVSLSNIMVGHDGSVKVVDFGIARSALSTVHTSPGVVRGKASYMSPEQCVGDAVDHRTDVFALGIVLYELTTGVRCFSGKTDFDRMLAAVRGDFVAPSDVVVDFPPEIERIVRTALATDPDRRYPSCAAMIAAISRLQTARGWTGGSDAIRREMAALFDHPLPSSADDEAPRTIENPVVSPPTIRITRPARLARGTSAGRVDPMQWTTDDDDARTGGRRALRRPSASRLAA